MTKSDKRMGKVLKKHRPDMEPSRLGPKPKAKPEPRYRVEEWWPKWCFGKAAWHKIGASKQLHEAERLLSKSRWGLTIEGKRRIVDTLTGEVLRERHRVDG